MSIVLTSRSGPDSKIHLEIPVGQADTEFEVEVVVRPKSPASHPVEKVFQELARAWKADTLYLSSTTAMTEHWAYQQIIRLGPPVVPFLLRELQQAPDFWFAALRAITGENPVQPQDSGKVKAMADAWVKWGAASNLLI